MTRGFRAAFFLAAFTVATAGAQPRVLPREQPRVEAPAVSAAWAYAAMGEAMGKSNVVIARVGDHREILVGARYPYYDAWYALRYVPSRNDYEQVFVSGPLPAPVLWMGVADVTGERIERLIVGLGNGEVRVHDLETKRLLATISTIPDIMGMTVADLDGDGAAEIIVTSYGFPGDLSVFSGSGSLLWQVPGAGGGTLAVGQMDDDPGLEIACSGGQIVDVATRAIQWDRPEGFGVLVKAADLDGDGQDELVEAEAGLSVSVFDVATQSLRFTIPTTEDISAIGVADTDCDGILEVIVADGQGGMIRSFDPATLAVKWQLPVSDGAAFFSVGDADGDGQDEIVWSSGWGVSGSDWLHVTDLHTLADKWTSIDLRGPFVGPAIGDVDGDGQPELVFASSRCDDQYNGGRLLVFDARTLQLRAISDIVGTNYGPIQDLKLRNVDSDPALEIVIGTQDLYDGVVEAFGFDGATNTFSLKWKNTVAAYGSPFRAVEAADVDRDGAIEIVAGGSRAHTGAEGTFVYVYDEATGDVKWTSPQLGDYWSGIRDVVVETAGGGDPDILAIVDGGGLYAFDGVTKDALPPVAGTFSVLRHNPFGAGRSVWLGDAAGNVYRYDRGPAGYELAATWALGGTAPIDGIEPLSASGALVGSAGRLARYDDLGAPPVWTSADYGWWFGRFVSRGVGAHGRWLSGGLYSVEEVGPGAPLSSVSPSSISSGGGDAVMAVGSGFQPGAELFVGDDAATDVQLQGTTQISGTAPAAPPGSLATVTVLNGDASFEVLKGSLFVDFVDVAAGDPIHDAVETVFRRGVTAGCGGGGFCPSRPLTRSQASVFLVRALSPRGFLAPKATGTVFSDVACGSFGADEIELLARRAITAGCGGEAFCPSSSLTRAQTAVLLLKGLEGAAYHPPPAQGVFGDVPADDPFAPWIEDLAARGITAGCGGGNFCPATPTTRGQMAVFLTRAFFAP